MRMPPAMAGTRVLISFSSAYVQLARRLADELRAAGIAVRYDQWEGGGGIPARQSVPNDLGDVDFVLPLLTPSDAAPTRVGEEWRQAVYEPALALKILVIPVLAEGDLAAVPLDLQDRRFANLASGDRDSELRSLIQGIRDCSGDSRIVVPAVDPGDAQASDRISLAGDPITLELGRGLAKLLADEAGAARFFGEMIPFMRDGLFYELGVPFGIPRLRPGSDLPPWSARILINSVPESQLEADPDWVLVNTGVEALQQLGLDGEPALNPVTGRKSARIPADAAAQAQERGLTTWDAHGSLILGLSSVLRRKAADFLGIETVQTLLDQVTPYFPQLVAETIPKTLSLFVLTDVLRRLVIEGVSIRNLRRILLTLANWGRAEKDHLMLAEYARAGLQREITHRLSRGTKTLIVFLLDPKIESLIESHRRFTATSSYVDLPPDQLRAILDAIREPMRALRDNVQVPQILTTVEIRSYVRRLVAPYMPELHVLSYSELMPDANIQPLDRITLGDFVGARVATADGVSIWR